MLIAPQNSPEFEPLTARIRAVQSRIAAAAAASGRDEQQITLVAVSKGHTSERIRQAAALGLGDFGENYLQEALPKVRELAALPLRWHFIGRLQANKTRAVAENFAWAHSVDRLTIAERLAAQRPYHAAPLQVCVQINIAGDRAKAGVAPADAAPLLEAIGRLPRLRLRGLMCMLPIECEVGAQQQAFSAMTTLQRALQAQFPSLDSLSMGMSDDFESAILAGATHVRIGTLLFGPRPAATHSQIPNHPPKH